MLFLVFVQKCDTSKHKVLLVSVCPQSLPFFAIKFHLDVSAAAQKLCGFLKSVGTSGWHIFLILKPSLYFVICILCLSNPSNDENAVLNCSKNPMFFPLPANLDIKDF